MATQTINTGPVFNGVVSRPKPSIVHVKGILDATGSTGPFNEGVERVISYLVDELPKSVGKAVFGLHIGRDRDFDIEHDVNLGDDLTADEVKNQLPLVTYKGGGDSPETQLDSILEVARKTAWTMEANTRKIIYVCTSSDSKKSQEGWDAKRVGDEVAQLGIKVILIAPPGLKLHDVATFSGGISIPLSNNPLQGELQSVCKYLTKTMTQMANSGGGTQALPTAFGAKGTVAIGVNP